MDTNNWRAAIQEGVYPVSFVEKLLAAKSGRVTAWLNPSKSGRLDAAIITPYEKIGGQRLIPFLGLVEARFVDHFRKHGLSLQTIRKAAMKMRADWDDLHPFANGKFRTDGKHIMLEASEDEGDTKLLNILTDEFVFPEIIEQSLFETVVYVGQIARKIIPFPDLRLVEIDPMFSLGRPIVTQGNIPTETLANAFRANAEVHEIADWFETTEHAVKEAIAFENRLAA
jgi:uncharacterized protein (DUF433 family)